jgi:hypothetical protein
LQQLWNFDKKFSRKSNVTNHAQNVASNDGPGDRVVPEKSGAHGPGWPAGGEGVTTSPQAQLQSEALDVQLKQPSSKQLKTKL